MNQQKGEMKEEHKISGDDDNNSNTDLDYETDDLVDIGDLNKSDNIHIEIIETENKRFEGNVKQSRELNETENNNNKNIEFIDDFFVPI